MRRTKCNTLKELAALSSGTIAAITGETNLVRIESIQSKLITKALELILAGKMEANLTTAESLPDLGVLG